MPATASAGQSGVAITDVSSTLIRHVMHMVMQVLLHLAHVSGLREKQASAIAACGCSMLTRHAN